MQVGRVQRYGFPNRQSIPTPKLKTDFSYPGKIGPYILGGEIGRGAFSVVKETKHETSNECFACKIISKRNLSEQGIDRLFENEVRLQQNLVHPCIVRIYDLLKDTLNYYVIMELCSYQTLFQCIRNNRSLSEKLLKEYVIQICDGLAYMHRMGVAHRDIKPENILVSPEGEVKIIDFGLATSTGDGILSRTTCGSTVYASPECLSGQEYDARLSDMWSLGVLIYTALMGRFPWTKCNMMSLIEEICSTDIIIPTNISKPCRDILYSLISRDPSVRMSAEELMECEWLKDVGCICYKLKPTSNSLSVNDVERFFENEMEPGILCSIEEKSHELPSLTLRKRSSTGKLVPLGSLKEPQHPMRRSRQIVRSGVPFLFTFNVRK